MPGNNDHIYIDYIYIYTNIYIHMPVFPLLLSGSGLVPG